MIDPTTHHSKSEQPYHGATSLSTGITELQNKGRKEGNVLFNDALNTFYLRLYGIGHMVKYHSDSKRGNLLPHGLLFPISSKGSFICTIPQIGLILLHKSSDIIHSHLHKADNHCCCGICFCAYIHFQFKHALLDTHLSYQSSH